VEHRTGLVVVPGLVASQRDSALWLESAGGGLRIGHVGPWLAALEESTWDAETAERRASSDQDAESTESTAGGERT
jgi:hypothetical protein